MFNNYDLFTQALGLQDPWKVDKVQFDQENGQLDIYVLHKRGSKIPCSDCGKNCSIHDTKERTWRHLNFFQFHAYIHCKVPRTKCDKHGVLQVEVPWSRLGSGFTLLFDAFIMELATIMPINSIAKLIGEHDTRIWRVVNHYVEEARGKEDYSEVKSIGIDETSSKRGHNYITVFVDLEESKVIYATEGKDFSTIKSFTKDLKVHHGNPRNIENVSCDMSTAFIKGTEENLPNADITFDKFHVMKKVNEALDEVRRMEQTENNLLKRTRYVWLKNPENLTKKQKDSLGSLSKMNLKTVKAYNLKLSLKEFWEIKDITAAAKYLKKWYFWATHSRIEPMIKLARFIHNHWYGIMRYIQSRINNELLEGINSLIQATKRKARGYRNIKNLITIVYLTCGKLSFKLPKAFV
ncbi:MAG: ISL3 family transposase [Halanaerobiales bacterium]|nr:ISL3 family transposase [Halanaerobiales bacterium]